jgi:hypothetical protein
VTFWSSFTSVSAASTGDATPMAAITNANLIEPQSPFIFEPPGATGDQEATGPYP